MLKLCTVLLRPSKPIDWTTEPPSPFTQYSLKYKKENSSYSVLGSESFTRGPCVGFAQVRMGARRYFSIPTTLKCKKFKQNLISAWRVWVSPLFLSIPTIQPALTEWQSIIHSSLPSPKNFETKSQKALQEPPKTKLKSMWILYSQVRVAHLSFAECHLWLLCNADLRWASAKLRWVAQTRLGSSNSNSTDWRTL